MQSIFLSENEVLAKKNCFVVIPILCHYKWEGGKVIYTLCCYALLQNSAHIAKTKT